MTFKRNTKLILISVSALILLLAYLTTIIWRSPPFYNISTIHAVKAPIMTMEDYGLVATKHPRPHVVVVESAKGAVLVYGASHTKDPANPQIADIQQHWRAFKPTVALVEGRLGFLFPGFMDPVHHYGEMGTVHALARDEGIPVYTWEPTREREIAYVLKEFPAKQTALFYILRPYFSNLRHGKPENPDLFVEDFRQKRTQYPGLENTFTSIKEIDEMWQRDFPGLPDWRDTTDEYGLPAYLADITAKSNAVRDEYLVQIILDLVIKTERVFVIAGSSHSVKIDSALKATLDPGLD